MFRWLGSKTGIGGKIMSSAFLETRNLYKSYGGIAATDHVDLDVRQSELHAVIGPNGAGKTTLISQLSGEIAPDGGRILFDGRDMTHMPAYKRSLLGLGPVVSNHQPDAGYDRAGKCFTRSSGPRRSFLPVLAGGQKGPGSYGASNGRA